MNLFSRQRVETGFWNSVSARKVTFHLAPEFSDFVDMVPPGGKRFRMVDPMVVELRGVENVVGAEAVNIDDTVRLAALTDNPDQGPRLGIRDHQIGRAHV